VAVSQNFILPHVRGSNDFRIIAALPIANYCKSAIQQSAATLRYDFEVSIHFLTLSIRSLECDPKLGINS